MSGFEIDYLGEKQEFFDDLALLWLREWGSCTDPSYIEKKKRKYRTRLNVGKIPFVLVAHRGHELMGSAGLSEHDLEKRPELTPWVIGVLVKPEFRKQGVATRLVTEVVERARDLGIRRLYLHTEKAQGLYEKLGWTFLEHTTNDRNEDSDIYFLDL